MGRSNVEYATDQITVYPSCPFKCKYCFWNTKLWKSRRKRIKPRPLEEAVRYLAARKRRVIVISFTTDPYPPIEAEKKITRNVLRILSHASHHKIMVLTKNPGLAFRDFEYFYRHGNMWMGTTVVTLEENRELEPYAPPPKERLRWLWAVKGEAIPTWLSIEPIIPGITDPLEIVEKTIGYIDLYVLGGFNYAKQLGFNSTYTEEEVARIIEAIRLLREKGKPFIIKRNLRRVLRLGGSIK